MTHHIEGKLILLHPAQMLLFWAHQKLQPLRAHVFDTPRLGSQRAKQNILFLEFLLKNNTTGVLVLTMLRRNIFENLWMLSSKKSKIYASFFFSSQMKNGFTNKRCWFKVLCDRVVHEERIPPMLSCINLFTIYSIQVICHVQKFQQN